MSRQRLVYSITLSGFLIAMSVILQRFLVIPYGVSSLYRLSLGNVPIIMASLFLGPLFGGAVGAASDLLGATLFPVGNLIIFPIISSTLYGVLPWLFLTIIKRIANKSKVPLLYGFMGLLFVVLELYVFLNDSIRHPFNSTLPRIEFTLEFRIIFTAVLLLIMGGVSLLFYFLEKKYSSRVDKDFTGTLKQLALAILLMGIVTDVFYSSWWKEYQFNVNFMVSVFFHTLIMLALLPVQTTLIATLGNVFAKSSGRFLGKKENSDKQY